jgi:hypothetical protein
MRSVSFVEDDGNPSQRHIATPLTNEILRDAITWLVGEEESAYVTWTSITDGFKNYLTLLSRNIPNDMSTDNLVQFIDDHQWTSRTEGSKIDQLIGTLRPLGGNTNANSPLMPLFNDEAITSDGYQLQRFIHENLAKETKIVIHMIDGIHRVTALDCALVGFDQNNRSDGTVGQALPWDIIEYARKLPHKHKVTNLQVYFLQGGANWSSELHRYQQLSYQIQQMAGQQMPHTVREIINHEITHLAQKCEDDEVPYLWDCLGVLYSTGVIGVRCTDRRHEKTDKWD